MASSVSKVLKCQSIVVALLASVVAPMSSYATVSEDYVMKASAVVQESPPKITLSWPASTGTGAIYVYRKTDADSWWVMPAIATLASTATTVNDTGVSVGTPYEYMVYQDEPSISGRRGQVYSGIKIPVVEDRGKIVLIVDNTMTTTLSSELTRLVQDLVGDGWRVLRHDVARTETVPNVKALIKADYDADPTKVNAVFLFGHVPVPYSGDINPDGHSDHLGAWPADVFYGDMNETWTDTTVNDTGASRTENRNVPGDGKYDQSTLPTDLALMVGRVDLANMPAFALSEAELLRQYLGKDHDFRQKTITAQARALVADNFTSGYPEGFAQSGWRFSPLVGAGNVTAGAWSSLVGVGNDYLLAYGCGPGSWTSVGGCATTSDYAANTYRAMFQMLFGSYFGDWDNTNNVLRAPLCNPTYGLTSCWVARPNWFIHHMALGKPIGYGARLATTDSLYYMSYGAREVHIALMGDPTLRLQYVAPPSAPTATAAGGNVDLAWTASPDTGILGYHVYRSADPGGPFTRLSTVLVSGVSYSDTAPLSGDSTYMIRAVRLETSASGTYYNASQGIFVPYTEGAVISIAVSPALWTIGARPLNDVVEAGPFTVQNLGNVGEDISIKGGNGGGGWSLQSVAGTNAFKVEVDKGHNGSYEMVLTTGEQTLATNVPVSGVQTLGLKYSAPSGDTIGSGAPQGFTITFKASKYVP
ncbi:MAG: fibronectin type III domain-containing protein [Candidatus Hydrogenedentes bacterium]|nr:fibronectin type III domain-containing protein [Candidatus Hydrogenedentota bacterium]